MAFVGVGLRAVNTAMQKHPVATACAVPACNSSVADLMVQVLVEKREFPENIDARRTLLFATFGVTYQGLLQSAGRVRRTLALVFSVSGKDRRAACSGRKAVESPFA